MKAAIFNWLSGENLNYLANWMLHGVKTLGLFDPTTVTE